MTMKTIELSLSENYVSNWGTWEAIREIIQNAQDADKQGNEMKIHQEGSSLTITSKGVKLPISSLVLGNTSKADEIELIGKYGEGYKLALIVLLRDGYKVSIQSGNDLWEPVFRYSNTYGTNVLCIDVYENRYSGQSDTVFMIDGLTWGDINELSVKSLAVRKAKGLPMGNVIDSDYGQILLDGAFNGRFYVEGLYIQDDDAFQYGYSFDSELVQLDRDRSAINYYDLLRLTTDSLMHQNMDASIVETAITSKKKDLHYLKDYYYSDVPDELAEGYAKYFNEKHNIDEDTFVGTEQEVLLSGADKTFVTNQVEAKIVNKGNGKEDEYRRIQSLATDKESSDAAWRIYNDSKLKRFHDWIILNAKRLSDKQINKLLDIVDTIQPDRYHLIKDDVQDNLKMSIRRSKPKFTRRKDL